ncbi:MAG: CHAT domain-containing protein, partial [Candidatus Limnocylindrales bacterium]
MAILDVRVTGSAEGMPVRYDYEFRSSDAEGTGPLEQEYWADVSPALVQDLCVKIDGIIEGARGSPTGTDLTAELAQFGGLLFQTLFPRTHGSIPNLVTRLGRADGPLLVRTNESLIPWELLHDGQGFFALRHELGRRSFVDRPVVGGRTIDMIGRALIVGDPMDDLALARREAENLAAWLTQRGTKCTLLLGSRATLLGVVGELASGEYDLLHYCGHVAVPYGTTDVGLVLHDRELLDERALHPLSNVGVPPLVFINGCSSAARLTNLCVSFMVMGAKAVVGTRYEVGEKGPQRFTELFYADLMEGVSAGAAVRAARHSLLRASDIDWTSFVLYADPAVRVVPDERESPKTAPLPPQLQGVEDGLSPQAAELMRRVVERARPRGVATSVDL